MKEEKKQILCFGEAVWDYLPDGRRPGGAPMNVALNLKRFGIKSTFATSVGDDRWRRVDRLHWQNRPPYRPDPNS